MAARLNSTNEAMDFPPLTLQMSSIGLGVCICLWLFHKIKSNILSLIWQLQYIPYIKIEQKYNQISTSIESYLLGI